MDQEELEELVARLEKGVARWPRLYRMRLALLGILGYAYILLVLLVTMLLTWLSFVLSFWAGNSRIGIGMLGASVALIIIVLRALWVRFPPVEGKRLRPRMLRSSSPVSRKRAVLCGRLGFIGSCCERTSTLQSSSVHGNSAGFEALGRVGVHPMLRVVCVSQIKAHETLLHLATEERASVNPLDTYRTHGLHELEARGEGGG